VFFLFNKKIIWLLAFCSIIIAKSNFNKLYFQKNNLGLGGFVNFSDGDLDFECLANIQNNNGLYVNIWINQIDYYEDTNIKSDISIGFNKKINNEFSIDLGYSFNNSFGLNKSSEIFLGANYKSLSFATVFNQNNINLESWYKPQQNFFDDSSLDFLFHGFIDNDLYDINMNLSTQVSLSLIFGIMLGYEHYFQKEKTSSEKNDQIYSYTIIDNSGAYSIFYLGFLLDK